MFLWRVEQSRARPALWFKRQGRYQFITWNEFASQVRRLALALHVQGVGRGDKVAILSENRPEWAFADLGILSLGAASVPIYPTSSVKETQYILEHAEVKIAFVSSAEQFEKVCPLLEQGKLKRVIAFDANLPEFMEEGRLAPLNNPDLFHQLIQRVNSEDLATLIYTSGTTGPPKGVMLTHGNFISNCQGSAEVLPTTPEDRSLSFLPLSHVFERMAGYYFMILRGVPIAYAESMQTVPEDLVLVRPTLAASVPRLFEKMHARILETIESGTPLKRCLFHWSVKVGKEAASYRQAGKPLPLGLGFRVFLARLLVFNKLKKRLGGRIRYFISGGAPLAKELAEFFYAAGVVILEGYGLTETSPVISVNRPERFKFGTVGPVLPGVEIKIAPDGEILTRGPLVMKGYFKNEEATREAIRDGWFFTGDLGEIDSEGFLKITGRKKDIIVTAGGKNISPQNLENEILSDCLFSQVIIVGDRRPYLVALVVPHRAELERLAAAKNIQSSTWEDLIAQSRVIDEVKKRLDERIKDYAAYEKIKYIRLLPKELTQEAGELTPTLKVKRRVVMEHFSREIEALYSTVEPQVISAHGRL